MSTYIYTSSYLQFLKQVTFRSFGIEFERQKKKMSERTSPYGIYENRNLRKQIGCMTGFFQLFDRHRFLTGWYTSKHKQKRLLLGAQQQMEPQNATKTVEDKEMEVQKQKSRMSKDESNSSSSSSSSSSTFSALDHNRTNDPESPCQVTAKNEDGPTLSQGPQSPRIVNAVKDSMHREARSVSIKSFTNNEQKVTTMKHVDSPRPLHNPKFEKPEKPKATSCEETDRVFARDGRLIHHRLSYDGRESRETLKTKHKELPRLSLDSKASSVKYSGLDSRLNFVGQESGSHSRTSSVVAKLMGLEDFPKTIITTDENKITKIKSNPKSNPITEESKEKQTHFSKPILSSRLPIEPAPWTQAHRTKSPKKTQNSSYSSVYAEMEKRITELEFKRAGKDLRALKQILEAMQKTRDKLENQRREPVNIQKPKQCRSENSYFNQNSSMPTQSCSSTRITKPAQITEKVRFSNSSNVPTVEKLHRQSPKKKTSRNSGLEQTLRAPQRIGVENYATTQRDSEMTSPKSRQNVLSPLGRTQKRSSKRVGENCALSKKMEANKSMDFQLSGNQVSEHNREGRYSSYQGDTASVKSESDYTAASHVETEVISLASSTEPNFREQQNSVSTSKEHMPAAVELAEQPSPVSVLDTAFYTEDLPSPIKKISTAFQEEESSRPDEAEWPLENLNHFSECKYTQNSQHTLSLIHDPRLMKAEPCQTTVNHNESLSQSLIPDQRYINKILAASGLFKDTCIMPTNNHTISSHLINPDIFHVLEEMEKENGALTEKNDLKKFNQKMQRRIVFDTVNEILVQKITSNGLLTLGRKRMGSERLVKELYLELHRLCGTPYENLEDEDDESIRLLAADMKYQSDDWTHYNGEVPTVVLEIERLIFKDLINEVVTGQIEGLHNLPKNHCRQLFTQ